MNNDKYFQKRESFIRPLTTSTIDVILCSVYGINSVYILRYVNVAFRIEISCIPFKCSITYILLPCLCF